VKLERVQQQRQEPSHRCVAAQQPLAVGLLDRTGVLAQLLDRFLQLSAADPGEDRAPQILVAHAVIKHQRAGVRKPQAGLVDDGGDLLPPLALPRDRAPVDLVEDHVEVVEHVVLGAQLANRGERGQRRDPPGIAHLGDLLSAGRARVHQQRPQPRGRQLVDPGQRRREGSQIA
jgi:hypothetical protein